METYVLNKPITFNGETITEINLDLENLSVNDLEKAEKDARKQLQKKEYMAVPEMNKKYQAQVAAIASGLPIAAIRSLGAKDYTQVCLEVQNFLLDGDSQDPDEESETKTPASGKTSTSTPRTTTNQPPTSTVSETQ